MRSQAPLALLAKVIGLGVIDALAVWAAVGLIQSSQFILLGILVVGAGLLNGLVLSKRAYPFRYLAPSLVFLFGMVVYPILYTAYVSLTNLQTGNLLPKDRVVQLFEGRYFLPEDSSRFSYTAYTDESETFLLLLTASDTGERFVAEDDRLSPFDPSDPRFIVAGDGSVTVSGYRAIEGMEIYQVVSRLETLVFPYGERFVRLSGIREFATYKKQYAYDAETDQLTDLSTGIAYRPIDGTFTSADGEELEPGFQVWVGFRHFASLFGSAGIRKDFARVFLWTVVWATLSVLCSFSLGLGLALLLNDKKLRMRMLYRTLLLVPYVMPVFISALVWRGMFNENFGVINRVFTDWFGLSLKWLSNPMLARACLIFINVWLSFPYMMLISLGALQSIPDQLYEAARVDGAGMFRRFWKVTLPLLMISLAPLLIGSFAFAFNNFTLIYLVTVGRPAVLGATTPAGATDILISWTYRIAFQGGAGNQYGLASAIAILIFVIIASVSAVGFRFTKRLEEVYK